MDPGSETLGTDIRPVLASLSSAAASACELLGVSPVKPESAMSSRDVGAHGALCGTLCVFAEAACQQGCASHVSASQTDAALVLARRCAAVAHLTQVQRPGDGNAELRYCVAMADSAAVAVLARGDVERLREFTAAGDVLKRLASAEALDASLHAAEEAVGKLNSSM